MWFAYTEANQKANQAAVKEARAEILWKTHQT
jgi:hypothetical protein